MNLYYNPNNKIIVQLSMQNNLVESAKALFFAIHNIREMDAILKKYPELEQAHNNLGNMLGYGEIDSSKISISQLLKNVTKKNCLTVPPKTFDLKTADFPKFFNDSVEFLKKAEKETFSIELIISGKDQMQPEILHIKKNDNYRLIYNPKEDHFGPGHKVCVVKEENLSKKLKKYNYAKQINIIYELFHEYDGAYVLTLNFS